MAALPTSHFAAVHPNRGLLPACHVLLQLLHGIVGCMGTHHVSWLSGSCEQQVVLTPCYICSPVPTATACLSTL